ncbi:MAG: hypothetical protein ACTSYD_12825 [Candidatus Heimdallarchaeaceae archaeon]
MLKNQKRNYGVLKKCVLNIFVFTLLFSTLIASSTNIRAYSTIITTSNHSYPVYQVLTLTLNNKTKGSVQAQTLIFNATSEQWVINHLLLDQIQEDLTTLPDVIGGLEQITLYDYNISYLPGCVYLLVSPTNFSIAGKVANSTIEYILNHSSTWWYVSNIYFDVFDLGNTFVDFEYLATWLLGSIVTSLNHTFPSSNNYSNFSATFPSREGIIPTNIIYNGSYWLPNEQFINYFNSIIDFINNQYIFRSIEVKLQHFIRSPVEHWLEKINSFNSTFYVKSETNYNMTTIYVEIADKSNNDTKYEIDIISETLSDFFLEISYPHKLDRTQTLQCYLTIYAMFRHLWFNTLQTPSWVGGKASFPAVFTFVSCSLVISVPIILQRTKKRLK